MTVKDCIQFYTILTLCSYIPSAFFDCGCHQNRRTKGSSSFLETNTKNIEKVCERQVPSNVYRDYYGVYKPQSEIGENNNAMALIKGGDFYIGTNQPHFEADKESPERSVFIKSYLLDKYEVSNNDFVKFIQETNYKTEAEIFGDSFLFETLLTPEMKEEFKDFRVLNAPWWYKIQADWKHPHGPQSNLKGLENHPVVHVSWNDANAYCKHYKKRLPTEAEWEVACRGGKRGRLFPWGNKLMPHNKHWLNIWQGQFPHNNTKLDGYDFTCPVNEFKQNSLDLYNIVGNVWEWTQDLWQPEDKSSNPSRVKKGGSYLCHKSYCYRYRCAARSQNTADSSAGNLGFRCAKDL